MKKLISAVLFIALMVNCCIPVLAYSFPQPDWGALLNERTKMVNGTEFELYAEGTVDSAPYYGAKFEPRGGTYIGSIAENAGKFLPLGSYLTYIDDMNQSDLYYPANSMIKNDSVITMVGWTINDINNVNYNQVRKTLDTLNKYNKPMFIRFANEMNVSALGNEPNKYIEVFRNVANMVHEYPNFAMVWSPNDMGALDRPFDYFYPGDQYVDWVGVSCYLIKYFQGNKNTDPKNSVYFMTGDNAWSLNKLKPFMEFLKKKNINKPVMISEGGVATSNSHGDYLVDWASPRLRHMLWYIVMKYPQIKMINYFDVHRANEVEKFDISNYAYTIDIFNQAKNSGAYITKYGKSANFVFQPANNAGTLVADDGIVPLYTLAHIANQPNLNVTYYIDGAWYHSAAQIPYTCNLNVAGLADGVHTLKIVAQNQSKEYKLFKRGHCIRFGAEPNYDIVNMVGNNPIKVLVNGAKVSFDQPPVIQNDRTLVPLRAIFEALDATVNWNDATKTATATKGGKTVSITIGSNVLYVNGSQRKLDVSAQLISSRTMVPVRAISEAFGCKVSWDGNTRTVTVNY